MSWFRRQPVADVGAPVSSPAGPPQLARQAWLELPTLAPKSLALSPVAESRAFTRGLTSHSAPPLILRAPGERRPVVVGRAGRVLGLAAVSATAAASVSPTPVADAGLSQLGRWFRRGRGGRGGRSGEVAASADHEIALAPLAASDSIPLTRLGADIGREPLTDGGSPDPSPAPSMTAQAAPRSAVPAVGRASTTRAPAVTSRTPTPAPTARTVAREVAAASGGSVPPTSRATGADRSVATADGSVPAVQRVIGGPEPTTPSIQGPRVVPSFPIWRSAGDRPAAPPSPSPRGAVGRIARVEARTQEPPNPTTPPPMRTGFVAEASRSVARQATPTQATGVDAPGPHATTASGPSAPSRSATGRVHRSPVEPVSRVPATADAATVHRMTGIPASHPAQTAQPDTPDPTSNVSAPPPVQRSAAPDHRGGPSEFPEQAAAPTVSSGGVLRQLSRAFRRGREPRPADSAEPTAQRAAAPSTPSTPSPRVAATLPAGSPAPGTSLSASATRSVSRAASTPMPAENPLLVNPLGDGRAPDQSAADQPAADSGAEPTVSRAATTPATETGVQVDRVGFATNAPAAGVARSDGTNTSPSGPSAGESPVTQRLSAAPAIRRAATVTPGSVAGPRIGIGLPSTAKPVPPPRTAQRTPAGGHVIEATTPDISMGADPRAARSAAPESPAFPSATHTARADSSIAEQSVSRSPTPTPRVADGHVHRGAFSPQVARQPLGLRPAAWSGPATAGAEPSAVMRSSASAGAPVTPSATDRGPTITSRSVHRTPEPIRAETFPTAALFSPRSIAPALIRTAETGTASLVQESPADFAVSSGLASRSADGSVDFGPPPGRPPPLNHSVEPPTIGREPAPAPSAAGTPGTATRTTLGAAGTGPGSGEAPGAADLSAMTDLLYERIEYRLRADLLLERERLGSLPDR